MTPYLIAIAAMFASVALEAWTATVVWGWLIAPSYHTGPLPFRVAVGAAAIGALLVVRPQSAADSVAIRDMAKREPLEAVKHAAWLLFHPVILSACVLVIAAMFHWLLP